jgi:hypothetical protein
LTVQRGTRSRLKLTLTWLTIVTALTFFTFTLVASAANPKPDYAAAAKQLPQKTPLVVVGDQLCSVDESQVAQLATMYDVGWDTLTVDGVPVDMVTVSGAKDRELREFLGDATCKLVKRKRVFFLPFDAHTS